MDNFWFGLQFSVFAMIIVMVALYLLSLVLVLFSKIFSGEKSPPKQEKGGQDGKEAPVTNNPVRVQDQHVSAMPLPGKKPEIVAAAMGALLFTLEGRQSRRLAVAKVTGGEMISGWGLFGRSRLLQLRQDFVSSKRGKGR